MTGKSEVTGGPPSALAELAQDASGRQRLHVRHLEFFVAMARAGSTRAAAERLSRSQSAASTAVTELEDLIGAPLFDRVGRRMVINENGLSLLPRAMSVLDQLGEMQQLFSQDRAVPLRVAASLTIGEYLLPGLVAQWNQRHPQSAAHLVIGNTSEVIDAVAAFGVDIGFIEGPQTHPDLMVRSWLTDELVVFASPTHPLAGRVVGLPRLREARWALRERGSGTREAADRWLLEHLGSFQVAFELGSPQAIKQLVASGTALGCLSRLAVAQSLDSGALVELKTRLPPAIRRLAMVVHRNKRLGRSTMDFVRQCLDLTPAGGSASPDDPFG